jgi:glucose/arabinose dehydrogenase
MRKSVIFFAAICIGLEFFGLTADALSRDRSKAVYATAGTCDGLPRIPVTTPPGICVGLFADKFQFPRGIAPLPDGSIVVADMGSWDRNKGSLWHVKRTAKALERTRLFENLDRPHGVIVGPDNRLYVGTTGRVFRFDISSPESTAIDVIGGSSRIDPLPVIGRHLLVSMVFGNDGDLYVNVGSGSDNCEDTEGNLANREPVCAEAEGREARGAIRRYSMQWPEGSVKSWRVFANGLRNSVALAVHPRSGIILQGENSRDAIHRHMPGLANDDDLPHDELNIVEQGVNYGWPYCYDDGKASPEYPLADCSRYRLPVKLLPAHASPLGMSYYSGTMFPADYQSALVMTYHGYRSAGHRVVVFRTDARGVPMDTGFDLVSGWGASDKRPLGAPTDIGIGADGAIYVSEDRNGTILRVAYKKK